jgi:hypothetical protein
MRDDRHAPLIGLALVGTLERVVIEWQEGRLHAPIPQVIDECTELFTTLFAGDSTPGGKIRF